MLILGIFLMAVASGWWLSSVNSPAHEGSVAWLVRCAATILMFATLYGGIVLVLRNLWRD